MEYSTKKKFHFLVISRFHKKKIIPVEFQILFPLFRLNQKITKIIVIKNMNFFKYFWGKLYVLPSFKTVLRFTIKYAIIICTYI